MAYFFSSRCFSLFIINGNYLFIISLEYDTNPNSNFCFTKELMSIMGFQLLFLLPTLDQWHAAPMCERAQPALRDGDRVVSIHLPLPSGLAPS